MSRARRAPCVEQVRQCDDRGVLRLRRIGRKQTPVTFTVEDDKGVIVKLRLERHEDNLTRPLPDWQQWIAFTLPGPSEDRPLRCALYVTVDDGPDYLQIGRRVYLAHVLACPGGRR